MIDYLNGLSNDFYNGTTNQFSTWRNRIQLKIRASYIASTISTVPVLIDENCIPIDFFSFVQNGGGDIRISSDSQGVTRLNIHVVQCNTITNELQLWVLVPLLSSVFDTSIYIFFGKIGASQPAVGSAFGQYSTYPSKNKLIYHLEEAGNNDINGYKDATGNTNHGTAVNMTAGSQVTAIIKKGLYGNGVNNRVSGPVWNTLTNGNIVSLRFLVKGDGTNQTYVYNRFFKAESSGGIRIAVNNGSVNGRIRVYTNLGINSWVINNMFDDNWHYIELLVNNGNIDVRMDGVNVLSSTYIHGTGFGSAAITTLFSTDADTWVGITDEFRISNTSIPVSQVDFENDNWKNPSNTIYQQIPVLP